MDWIHLGLIYLAGNVVIIIFVQLIDRHELGFPPELQDPVGCFILILLESVWTGLFLIICLFKLLFDLIGLPFGAAISCAVIPGLLFGLIIYLMSERAIRSMVN